MKKKVIRTATVPQSLGLLKGQLSFLKQYYDVIAVSGSGEKLKIIEKSEGIRCFEIEMQRRISPIKDLISLIRLYVFFKREKPVIVHSITPKAGLLTMLAGRFAGVPVRVHTFTGLIFPTRIGFVQKLLITTDRLLCWASTNIYPEGQGVKNDLINYKITSKPLKVIANGNINGINTDYFNPKQITEEQKKALKKRLYITEKDFLFIFVGRLVSDKGINELVAAFPQVKDELGEYVKLLLVGSEERDLDPLRSETIKAINEDKNIVAVGYQNDVRPYFAISNCLVFPSYREGFPNVVMQAGAMGLPSIVSDINGCNEIVEENSNGLVVPPKNTEKLINAMLKLYKDEQLRNSLKENSRKVIIERYQQKILWNALLAEYQTLIEK